MKYSTMSDVECCGTNHSSRFTVTAAMWLLIFAMIGFGFSSQAQLVLPVLEDIDVSCLEEVPAPGAPIATCDGDEYEGSSFSSNTGELIEECDLSTAIGLGDDWSLWLPTLDHATANFIWDADGGTFEQFADGTAHLFGTAVNDVDPTQQYIVDLWMENAADWTTWSGMGRSYKDDANLVTDEYEDWTYYELANGFSTLTGAGALVGSELFLTHMPADYFFGFQIGEAANCKNDNFGMSGWFTFEGMVDGEPVDGHGDINVDASCEPVNLADCVHSTEFTYLFLFETPCGNGVVEQMVNVSDEIAPEFSVFPADFTAECDEAPFAIEPVEATDNCTGDVTVEGPVEVITDGDCPNAYTIERTWTAFDICGNVYMQTQTITVEDTTAPVLSSTPEVDLTVECDMVPDAAVLTATDNCSDNVEVVFEEEIEEGNCPNNYQILRNWTATDECGNEVSASQTINVQDTTAPVIELEAQLTFECDAADDIFATATDNCSDDADIVITYTQQLQSGGCLGVLVRTYTATDECGNSSTAVQYITLVDTTAPVLEVPADETLECDEVEEGANGLYFDAADGSATDNCGEEVTVVYSEQIVEGDCPQNFTVIRTWIATDYCENEAEMSSSVTVQDTTAPEFTFVPEGFDIECSEEIPAAEMATAEDNCGIVEVEMTELEEAGACEGESTLTRMFRAFDECGNEAMAVQIINIIDTTEPELTIPENLILECDEEVPASEGVATDNCSEPVVTMEEVTSGDDCETIITRTFTATDDCGNATEATQTITILDTVAPVLTTPNETVVEITCDVYNDACGIETGFAYIGGLLSPAQAAAFELCNQELFIQYDLLPAVSDNCDEDVVYVPSTLIPTVAQGCEDLNGSTNVKLSFACWFTAEDECGNEADSVVTYLNIVDFTPPVLLNVPADETVECSEVDLTENVTATDDCDIELPVELVDETEEGTCEGEYTITRTWTATDLCGNETSATQVITVVDTTAPEFTEVPGDMMLDCADEVPASDAAAEDNCSEVTITQEDVTTGDSCETIVTRTFTATDDCGNSTTAVQVFTLVDTTAPELEIAGDVTIECDEEVPAPEWTTSDDCSTITEVVTEEMVDGDCPQEMVINRTYTVTDACGNETALTQVITIVDTTAPEFTMVPGNVTIECDEAVPADMATAEDNCGMVTVTSEDVVAEDDCEEVITRTFTAVDECGNESSATQIITIVDTTAPVITGEIEIDMPCDMVDTDIQITAEDNCNEVTITFEDTEVSGGCAGRIIRDYTATDACGNASMFQQIITLIDVTAPVIEGPAGFTVECDEQYILEDATVTDNCDDDVELTVASSTSGDDCETIITRTWTAIDHCDNESTFTQEITIVDTTAPEVVAPADLALECDEETPITMATAEDNCNLVTISYEDSEAGDACELVITRTFTATDACGNAATAVQTITKTDNTAPEFVFVPNNTTIECDEALPTLMATASDNCNEVTVTMADELEEGDCESLVTRTFTATDACGNAATMVQEITIVDTTAPVVSGPLEVDMPCDDIDDSIMITAEDNCNEVTITYIDTEVSGGCAGRIIRDYTVTDACQNVSMFQQIITLIDETAPVFDFVPESFEVECGVEYLLEGVEVSDNCTDFEIELEVVETGDSCETIITRTWTATDDCDNVATAMQTITIVDTTAPEFTMVPADAEYDCEDTISDMNATAEDLCSSVTVTFSDEIINQDCPQTYTIERTYVAIDACGNTAEATSLISVSDEDAPEFTSVPADVTIECSDALPTDMASAEDNCGIATVSSSDEFIEGDCPNTGMLIRTFTAVDECGNEASVEQTIMIEDTVAPELSEEPADLVLDCSAEIPAAPVVTATDACDDVEVEYTEEIVGEEPTPGSSSDCLALDSTNEDPAWSLWLQDFENGDEYYILADGTTASYVTFPDGTAHLTGTVVSTTDPANGWDIDVMFEDGMDWDMWSTQSFPTSFKDDEGFVTDEYLDWTYYILNGDAATLTGTGGYAGSLLTLDHAPSSLFYGFQEGLAANNRDEEYGFGGWFYYEGFLSSTGFTGDVDGGGDFAFDLDCCPRYEIIRTWTAEDCSGNLVTWTQNISFEEGGEGAPIVNNDNTVLESKGDVDQTTVYPNPVAEKATIEFVLVKDSKVVLDVYDMNGMKVATLLDANVNANVITKATFNAIGLPAGMYTYSIRTNDSVITKRILVGK